jgi:ABC-2 type transport system permease protein
MTAVTFDDAAVAAHTRRRTGVVADSRVVARRNLLRWLRTPQVIVFSIQPIMFMLLFRYVFGGAIPIPGIAYVDYLVPALLAQNILFDGFGTSIVLAEDTKAGIIDRFRSLPMSRSAFLGGRMIADGVRLGVVIALTLGIGSLVGFRFHGGLLPSVFAIGLCFVFAIAFFWVFAFAGLAIGDTESVQAALMPIFPLTFVSTAFVPLSSMAGWLQPIAEHQPFTQMVNAMRCLTQGGAAEALLPHSTGYYVVTSILWSVGIAAAFAPPAIRKFRRG